jgi:hypothetical protein
MGFRLLATHKIFNAHDEEVSMFFKTLKIDPLYQKMCTNQNCFRARVSPKPWRIGISNHLRPRPGVWPIDPEKMHLRKQWVDEYASKAHSFSSCKFIEEIGSQVVHEKILKVQNIHDDLCRANSDLPMA